jgi:hypothetical protein
MQSLSVCSSCSASSVNPLTRYGPTNAIGTEPAISHAASRRLGEPSLACVIAPPVL